MPTARLADRQIRAAAHAALRLDVRGPVSEALARTGVTVPPADEAPEAPPPASVPQRTPARRTPAAPRVLKPFAEAPWPTRRPQTAAPHLLSGLTADERRVHHILIDTLDIATEQDPNSFGGLSYAGRRALEALDLAHIDAELNGKPGDDTLRTLGLIGAAGMLAVAVVVAVIGSWAGAAGLAAGAVALGGNLLARGGGATGQRRKILLALRELALVAHADGATSDALAQADRLIDRLAEADEAPRLALPYDPLSNTRSPQRRARVRS